MILDIRAKKSIDGIIFDESGDKIFDFDGDGESIGFDGDEILCTYDDLDNFIAALRKAKELWGEK